MAAQSPAPLRGLSKALGKRFIDVGLCDETLVGAAAGLALRGRTPVVHASASVLAQRAFELVRTEVGAPRLPVTLVGFVPGASSEAGEPAGPALDDLALMRAIPEMQVFCPADREELREALPVIVASGRPAYVRYTAAEPAVEHLERFAIGRAEVLASEDGVSILSCGPSLRVADAARRILAARGVPVRLVNLRSLEPFDEDALADAVCPAELVVTLEPPGAAGRTIWPAQPSIARRARSAGRTARAGRASPSVPHDLRRESERSAAIASDQAGLESKPRRPRPSGSSGSRRPSSKSARPSGRRSSATSWASSTIRSTSASSGNRAGRSRRSQPRLRTRAAPRSPATASWTRCAPPASRSSEPLARLSRDAPGRVRGSVRTDEQQLV
jgi:transketolase